MCPCHQQVPPGLLCLGWLSCPTLIRPRAWLSPNHALPLARAAKHQESSPLPTPRCCTGTGAVTVNPWPVPLLPRSPEQGKAAAGGPDSCIEPVSPPDGVGEAEHAKSAPYPVLFREGEPMDQRYGLGAGTGAAGEGDVPTHGLAQAAFLAAQSCVPSQGLCLSRLFNTVGCICCWDSERGWRC